MELLILLFVSLPLLSALLTGLLAPSIGHRVARVSVALTLATFVLSALLLGLALAGHQPPPLRLGGSWGGLLLDPLSTLMGLLISGISLIVHLYSVRYMAEEAGYARFFVLLDLMTATLLIMVAAGDLVTLLVAWHLIGVLLYFLLGHNTRSHTAYDYGMWTFFTYRLGDLPLVLAAALLYQAFGTWSLPEIFAAIAAAPGAQTLFGLPLAETVGYLVALAAFARSAQFFFHTWLPYTMEGPTPVSALMHAGIVNAGGFLLNRFAPLFVHTDGVLQWVFLVGLVTALVGSVLMLSQNDIKKSLGYSTMGQMGFMVMECGVGAFSLAIYHLIAHGLFKGTLFLGAGGVIHAARRDDGVPKEDLYTFLVERRPARRRQPWLLMAVLTLAVPVVVLVLAHWLVAQNVFHEQGAVVLLFFGWITGAQLIFATYRMRTTNIRRTLALTLISFTVVVVGYTVVSHGLGVFLYPDPGLRSDIFEAADIDLLWFDMLMVLVALIIVAGWVSAYYARRNGRRTQHRKRLWLGFYSVIARELYLVDLYDQVAKRLLAFAARLNAWLRWA